MQGDAIRRALAHWPQLAGLAGTLLERWPELTVSPRRWEMDQQTGLTVIVGEAFDGRAQLGRHGPMPGISDGFAPAKNPDMWSAELMQAVADKTPAGRNLRELHRCRLGAAQPAIGRVRGRKTARPCRQARDDLRREGGLVLPGDDQPAGDRFALFEPHGDRLECGNAREAVLLQQRLQICGAVGKALVRRDAPGIAGECLVRHGFR